MNIFVERASASNKLKENNVWVFGFDNFTPKNQRVTELSNFFYGKDIKDLLEKLSFLFILVA